MNGFVRAATGTSQLPKSLSAAGRLRPVSLGQAPSTSSAASENLDWPRKLPDQYRHDPQLSIGRRQENLVIQADNLIALMDLATVARAKIRCVYLDPPYNNQEVYRHYRDKDSHEEWLGLTIERLRAVPRLLASNGSVWISIDDREMHYLKVEADRVFGRENFISTIVWEQRTTRENRKVFSNNHEYILVYAANAKEFARSRNLLPPTADLLARYKNPDNDPRGPWQSVSANVQDGHATEAQYYRLLAPNGTAHRPPEGRCWVYDREKMQEEIKAGNIWFGTDGTGVPRIKLFLRRTRIGLTPETLWTADRTGTNDEAKKHLLQMFPSNSVFDTPKPELLLSRIIDIATDPGDWVLDPYLGSGTTAAVAHKMKRRYIGIENGRQAVTHCAQRLRLVVEGEQGGVSNRVNWKGGGGFAFFRRSP